MPLVVYETRDQAIHLTQGARAAATFGLCHVESYDYHWRDNPQLLDKVWSFRAKTWPGLATEPILGGLDGGGGTWLAMNRRTGVYARILIAPMASGALGESASDALRSQRATLGYVTRSGVCIDAATYPTAQAAVEGLRVDLPAALAREGRAMLPFFVLVADASDAFVVHYREDGTVEATRVAEDTVHVLSVRGLNSPLATLTEVLSQRLAGVPLPDATPESWDPWLAAFSLSDRVSDMEYLAPGWRAHRTTVLQPPYLNTQGPTRHQRAPWPSEVDSGEVEWTKSTTCAAIGPEGLLSLMFEERNIEPGKPWPATISEGVYPLSSADYRQLRLAERSALN